MSNWRVVFTIFHGFSANLAVLNAPKILNEQVEKELIPAQAIVPLNGLSTQMHMN